MIFGTPRPTDINDLFDHWSKKGSTEYNSSLLIAASALCSSPWIKRNEIVFDKCQPKSLLVLFRGTYWLHQWAQLQWLEERRQELENTCRLLEISSLQLFASSGWSSSFRILSAWFTFSKIWIYCACSFGWCYDLWSCSLWLLCHDENLSLVIRWPDFVSWDEWSRIHTLSFI